MEDYEGEFKTRLRCALTSCDLIHNRQQVHKLKQLGFIISKRKTHVMLVYAGRNKKHSFFVPSTTSDRRVHLNLVSKIMKELSGDLNYQSKQPNDNI